MFVTAITAAVSLFQMPLDVPLPAELESRSVQVVLQATDTHFVARNTSLVPQLLLFGSETRGMLSQVSVQPGMRAVFPFADGASDDVWVEVISSLGITLRNTGAFSIAGLRQAQERTIWIESTSDHALGWQTSARGLLHVQPVGGLVPTSSPHNRTGLRDFSLMTSTHVPVVAPNDDQRPPTPPKIDEQALPPI